MYLYYINNKKETFENLDTFIKKTNNGQWNFSTYNPYANLNEYNDSFILLYNETSSSDITSMNYKELMKYNKEKLESFKNNEEINNQIENLLNKYNKTDNKIANIERDFRKMGLEYIYTVPLTSAYEKLNYIKNKTRLKTSINNFLIKDLRKYLINKYIEPTSITNQIDADNNITVSLKYTLLDSKKINTDGTSDNDLTTIKLLQQIEKYLKFDIINNGTTFGDSTEININFKIINYDNNENMVSIINDKVEILYKILFTEILNTNDEENILNRIDLSSLPSEDALKNISLYGYDTLKINQNDISPNCSVPSGDKTILNAYSFDFNQSKSPSYGIGATNLQKHKQYLLSGIKNDKNNHHYNCNIYDISYNLNNKHKFTLNIYDNVDHFDTTVQDDNNIYTKNIDTNKIGVMYNNDPENDFDTYFNINVSPDAKCISPKVDTTSNQIKRELENLRSIQGLDKRAQNNVKAILFANLNLNSFKNFVNANLKERNNLIRLRIQGKAYKFLDEIKKIESINSSILQKLKNEKDVDIDITEDKLIGAVHFIMEKHIRENNEEFYLKEKVLFNDQTLRTRNELIKEYIKETPSSELEKLFFMTTREKVDYFDNNTANNSNLQNSAELELKLIEKMKTNELENYFKEVNTMTKDVNDRLKVIISTNSNIFLDFIKN